MYDIKKTDYGLRLTFRGRFDSTEAMQWLEEFRMATDVIESEFYVFVDMRNLIPLSQEGKDLIQQGQEYALASGMLRSVVILSSPVITMQFKAIASQSGIFDHERYIDATCNEDWEQLGLDWILHAKDPDAIPVDRTL